MKSDDYVFCRRKSDGKYYRGSYFWKWTKEWRYAAVLQVNFWENFYLGTKLRRDDVDLVNLNSVRLQELVSAVQ